MTSKSQKSQKGPSSGSGSAGSSILLDKNKLIGRRRSTPDSEAIASSDDERDHAPKNQPAPAVPSKPGRRPSWLSEVNPLPQRKVSFTGRSISSANSQPTTPSGEAMLGGQSQMFGLGLTRTQTNESGSQWSQQPSSAGRKDPPARLQEVLQSPTARINRRDYGDDGVLGSPRNRDTGFEGAFPFQIPLNPTPKSYRSMSYSVGQLENEAPQFPNAAAATMAARGRGTQASMKHRTSRPSMLGELSLESLGRVREDEADEAAHDLGNTAGMRQPNWHTGAQNQALRDRGSHNAPHSACIVPSGSEEGLDQMALHSRLHELSLDQAVDDGEATPEHRSRGRAGDTLTRRMSEYAVPSSSYQYSDVSVNAQLDNIRRRQWQSSLGFEGIEELSHSRRHSLANVPQRGNTSTELQGRGPLGIDLSGVSRDSARLAQQDEACKFCLPQLL